MNKNTFNISLINNNENFFFKINKNFFNLFKYNYNDFKNPNINIFLNKKYINNYFIFKFNFIGKITLFCDITYKKFNFKIKNKKILNIFFYNKKYIIENDNSFMLPYNYKIINISQYIYESILFMIPIKKIYPKIKKKLFF
ncbi:MAG: hypothetical protein RDO_0020 [Flavobacteriales endosymbiont of Rhyzopertha dominica]|nr:MAG: hypothetical protein NHG05_00300 [Candidatus Shikimatogenerans bostrichidophilus]